MQRELSSGPKCSGKQHNSNNTSFYLLPLHSSIVLKIPDMLARNLIIILCMIPIAKGYCPSSTITAYPFNPELSYTYSSDEDCTFTIKPVFWMSRGFFLEISWSSFNVKGEMPDCKEDYIEVFLTRSKKSIGKFCSSNLEGSSLFTMYSYDGHATIKFHSDNSGSVGGFKMWYTLRPYSDYLSGNDGCSLTYLKNAADVLYSSKWPRTYESHDKFDCKIKINKNGVKKIVFMDLDLRERTFQYNCNSFVDDYVEIRGSNDYSGYSYSKLLKSPFCADDDDDVITYTTSLRNVYVHFKRQSGSTSSKRGLVAGYVTYQESKTSPQNVLIIVFSILIPCLFVFFCLVGCICICVKRVKKQHQQPSVINQQAQNTDPVSHEASRLIENHPTTVQMPPSYEEAVAMTYQTEVPQEYPAPIENTPPPAYNPKYGAT